MAFTDINSEDRLVQKTFADHLHDGHGWESVHAFNDETSGPEGTLGRADTREVVLMRDLRAAIARLNPELPTTAVEEAAAAYKNGTRRGQRPDGADRKLLIDHCSTST